MKRLHESCWRSMKWFLTKIDDLRRSVENWEKKNDETNRIRLENVPNDYFFKFLTKISTLLMEWLRNGWNVCVLRQEVVLVPMEVRRVRVFAEQQRFEFKFWGEKFRNWNAFEIWARWEIAHCNNSDGDDDDGREEGVRECFFLSVCVWLIQTHWTLVFLRK